MAEPAVDAFAQGLELMLAGMGTVFVFLTLLVAATTLMSALVQRFTPDIPGHVQGVRSAKAGGVEDGNEGEVIAAITVAVAAFRQHRSGSSSSTVTPGSTDAPRSRAGTQR
ncbi:MAG: OadG family protein [Pseudomonadaceae bacterium]|nr:OadG family protein [Pseudomonadaceae bacterium]